MRHFKIGLGLLTITTFGGFAGARFYQYFNKDTRTIAERQNDAAPGILTGYMPESNISFVKAAEQSVHAVVYIKTTYAAQSAYNDPFQEFLFGGKGHPPVTPEASGSGVIISDDGYIATNNHVVENAEKVTITLNNKRSYTARVIGRDPATDLALLKIDEKNLPFVRYGNSDEVRVGEWVLAVGNPFNLTSTVTAGIVSAKARNINLISDGDRNPYAVESFIQTDAAVNRGNSGGALVNTNGQLIGINTAIASTTGVYAGYAFAVPVNIVRKVMEDLLQYGEVKRAMIGVSIQDVTAQLAEEKGLSEPKGVFVARLTPNGAARESGIKEGDVITKVGEMPVNSSPELQEQVSKYRPGDKVMVSVIREGKEKVIPVTFKDKTGSTIITKTDPNSISTVLGADFESLNQEDKNRFNLSCGVKIAKLSNGKLRSTGIREGFIIYSVDNREICTKEELVKQLSGKNGGVLIEGIYPNGVRAYYAFGL